MSIPRYFGLTQIYIATKKQEKMKTKRSIGMRNMHLRNQEGTFDIYFCSFPYSPFFLKKGGCPSYVLRGGTQGNS